MIQRSDGGGVDLHNSSCPCLTEKRALACDPSSGFRECETFADRIIFKGPDAAIRVLQEILNAFVFDCFFRSRHAAAIVAGLAYAFG